MTIGEHLDELRACLIRSLLALVIACLVCIWPAKFLLELLARPVVLALRAHGQPETFLATSPVEAFLVYIKVVLIFGLLLAAPYILKQFWDFVGAGLYANERRWVVRLFPVSIGLFLLGVAFMYVFALVVSLNFLVGVSSWLPQPDPKPNIFERSVLGIHAAGEPNAPPDFEAGKVIPLLADDPNAPPTGAVWVNTEQNKLKVQRPDGRYAVQLQRDEERAMVTTHFKIGDYLSFVLVLMVAFGLAFQLPLVVIFLAWSGIMPTSAMRKYRRVVILVIVIVAGVLAPPDLLSHLLLSVPMYLLFEIGLLLAGRTEKQKRTRAAEQQAAD